MTGDGPAPPRRLQLRGGALVLVPFVLAGGPLARGAPAAQRRASGATATAGPDAAVGYSYVKSGSAGLHGVGLSVSWPTLRSLRLVGEVSAHFGSFAGADLGQQEVLAGVQRVWPRGRLRPFAVLRAGIVRTKASVSTPEATLEDANSHLGLVPGLGVDYGLGGRLAARAAADLMLVRAGGWEADPRFTLGVVYRFP